MDFGDFFGSMFSGVGSALIGNYSSSRAATRAYEFSKLLQEHQYQLNRNALREYYSNNRYSLEKAGYNPLLALPGSTAQGFSASANMSPTENNLSEDFARGVSSYTSARNALQDIKVKSAQKENIDADTDIKRYGQKGAILKNLIGLLDKAKGNPVASKAVEGMIVGASSDNGVSSAISSFKNDHPTTLRVLNKLKNGDFKGAKYELDLRRKRLSHTSNSAVGSYKGIKFEYRPDLDKKGSLPYELAKYHK